MYTGHFYAATHKQEVRKRTAAALKTGLPTFVSESADMDASVVALLNEAEWKNWIDFIAQIKLS
jgi:endoglucanase